MRKIRTIKKLISLLLLLSLIPISGYAAPMKAYADTNSVNAGSVCINTISKYLYLGDSKADKFEFRIVGVEQETIAESIWYIETTKGNPNSIMIDRKTGLVKARKAGTAYIYCEIKQKDGTVLKPEAKVTVINNITEVAISNLPENMTFTAGQPVNFDRAILNTSAGVGKKASGVTRWEITEDAAGAGSADSRGIVYPTKAGTFKIRAICFQNDLNYQNWLVNKKSILITAASEWQTIKVVSSDGKAVANTQEQLNKALAAEEFSEITLITKNSVTFFIEENDYQNKTLIVDTPNADILNYGKFQQITIKAIKDSTWIEYADGNIIYLSDTQSSFVIEANAIVKQIVIDQANSVINLEINGRVDMISVMQPAKVNLSGSGSNIPLTIDENAGQSIISTSIPVNLSLHADAQIVLNQGSEASKIDKSASSVEVKVENNSKMQVTITTNKFGEEIIYAGTSGLSDETTIPVQPAGPTYNIVNATGLTITPQSMVLSVTGSAISMLVAEVTPENAAYDVITWRSADESIATVDEDGVVTPVAEGTTPIIAMTGDLYASAYVTVVSGSAIAVSGSAIQTGLLQSAGSTIAAELAKGATAYVGGELMGWGLAKAGIGFEDESQTSVDNMIKKLNDIEEQLNSLGTQLRSVEAAIDQAQYSLRVSDMTTLISYIKSFRRSLNTFFDSSQDGKGDLEKQRNLIMKCIEDNLIGKEYIIHDQLTGGETGQEPLIKLYSRVIKGKSRFLSSKDSATIQAIYDYFEGMQTNMLELMIEYYHASGNNGEFNSQIIDLLDVYNTQITEQRAFLLPSVPENVVIDKDRNIMVYTGHYMKEVLVPELDISVVPPKIYYRTKRMSVDAPWYGNIPSESAAYNNMCYNYNFNNWRLLTYDELVSWRSASNNQFGEFLKNIIGLLCSEDRQIIHIFYSFDFGCMFYDGFSVNNGELVSTVRSYDGGKTFYDPKGTDGTLYMYYYIVCRTMNSDELGKYFY